MLAGIAGGEVSISPLRGRCPAGRRGACQNATLRSSFQGGARSEATRADPGIHAVTPESRHGTERSPANTTKQLEPFRVGLLDQFDLPLASPAFQSLLPCDRALCTVMSFVPDQAIDGISFGEPFSGFVAVLPYTTREIAGNADIQCAAGLAGQNVNEEMFFAHAGNLTRLVCQISLSRGRHGSRLAPS